MELIKYLNQKDIVAATIDQLCKDFSIQKTDLNIPTEPDAIFKSLHAQIENLIVARFNQNPQQALNTLYKIDLPEKQINSFIKSGVENKFSELARQIIFRELYKVLLRKGVIPF